MKYKTAILGATGIIGQRYVQLLQNHKYFEITLLTGNKSVGKKYKNCNLLFEKEIPKEVAEMKLVNTELKELKKEKIEVVFSALPTDIAENCEEEFAKHFAVFSKASANRMKEDVPIIIPEVNPNHLELIAVQRKKRRTNGFITTDANCSTTQLCISLKPLEKLGIKNVSVVSMQALSGAGYPGVPSLDIIDNVIPFIPGEEEKIENESKKILGKFRDGKVENADFEISASCNRVNVKDGHLQVVNVSITEEVELSDIKFFFKSFNPLKDLNLPSARIPIVLREEENRPQPRIDRNEENGMSVVIGRVKKINKFSIRYYCLGHNTIRGGAGNSILQAELCKQKGVLR